MKLGFKSRWGRMDKKTSQSEGYWWKILAILISVGSLFFSFYTYLKLLPLSQANVVFSEQSIEILPNIEKEPEKYDAINPTFRNIGKARAMNIRLQIYALPFDKNITWEGGKKIEKYFNFELIHNLEPDSSSSFGHFKIFHHVYGATNNEKRDLASDEQNMALIFCLEYLDSISKIVERRTFLYHYVIGTREVMSLISDDYDKVKERLFEELKKDEGNVCDKTVLQISSVNI